MNRNDAAILGLRLLAIFAWFQALEFFAGEQPLHPAVVRSKYVEAHRQKVRDATLAGANPL
jgi:hypothetical protein